MEACAGADHLARRVDALGHDVRLMAAKYVRPFCRKQKNDFNDAQAIAEAVTRPTVRYVALKTPAQLDLQALHRLRERLISQRTSVINQIPAFLRGIAIRQGWRALRDELPRGLTMTDRLTPRMVDIVEDLAGDWRRLDERIEAVSTEIAELAHADDGAVRLMSVPGIGPIICSATRKTDLSGKAHIAVIDLNGRVMDLTCRYLPAYYVSHTSETDARRQGFQGAGRSNAQKAA
jgi:transposase